MLEKQKPSGLAVIPAWADKVFAQFREGLGDAPFRRADLLAVLYPKTRPRNNQAAGAIGQRLIKAAVDRGEIVKAGHVHWRFVSTGSRTLKDGRVVTEHSDVVQVNITTRCPEKYVLVDLETGDVWNASLAGYKVADQASRRCAQAILGGA